MRHRRTWLVLASCVAAVVVLAPASGAPAPTLRVANESEFASAVAALRDTGGTIVLLRHDYRGTLVVPPRSSRRLWIVGVAGARVGRILLDHTTAVSIGRLVVSPLGENAWIDVDGSSRIELRDLLVTARTTLFSASVLIPGGRVVVIRHDEFTHCGDRSYAWANCVLLAEGANDVTIEDSWFHDCLGCDFVHGRFGARLTVRHNIFGRALPCRIGRVRCGHQDLIELFAGEGLLVDGNRFGVYRIGGAQLYLTSAIDHARIVNNLFVGTDPRVPGYRSRVGLIVGSSGRARLPLDVLVANNTILTGARRNDGYTGSIRMSSRYASVPRPERPILANNVIGVLSTAWPVCRVVRASVSNVVLVGRRCSRSDRVGGAKLDPLGRPTEGSTLLLGRADPRYAPATDITGRRRRGAPDIGAFQHSGG